MLIQKLQFHTFFGLAAVIAAAGCADSSGARSERDGDDDDAESAPTGSLGCDADCPGCPQSDAAELFEWGSVPVFDFWLPEERWEYLNEHALDEEYEEACVAFEGQPIGAVGLRFKGSYGTLIPCIDERGELICTKLGMKVKFNEIHSDLRFYGLKRLNFHSMIHDESKLHERLGYDLYREMGIASPRSAWAVVRVNEESYGLFSMVEQVDGRFTDDRWPQGGDGNLYKEAWPSTDNRGYYLERLKTNEETGKPDAFIRFAAELSSADPEELGSVLAGWMDFEQLSRYMAVDEAIFNCDGITAFYTDEEEEWTGNHNYYFYQGQSRDVFTIIPWDLDSTFVPRASWSLVPRWDVIPEDCSLTYPVWSGDISVVAPGCDPVFQAIASDKEPYRAAVDELLEGPFAEETVLAKIDALAGFIAGEVESDPLGPSRTAWEGSLEQLKATIAVLRDRLARLRDERSVVPLGLDTAGVNDFEAVDDFQLALGSTLISNASTTAQRSLNRAEVLLGTRDVRIDFEYRNESDAWGQWINLSIPLSEGIEDLSAFAGIRLLMKADRARTVRMDLDSPANSRSDEGIRRGWDVSVGSQATEVEVMLAEAEVPIWAIAQGNDPQDPLDDVLSAVTALTFSPGCLGRNASGFLPDDSSDVGYLQIDGIEFVVN